MFKTSTILGRRSFSASTFLKFQQLAGDQLKNDVNKTPLLSDITKEKWETTCEIFQKYGFKNDEVLKIVEKNKSILKHPANFLNHNIEFWRGFEFGQRQFQELILVHPEILDVKDYKHIANKISYLKYFVKTPKNVWLLLLNSPEILTRREEIIKNYFLYLEERMRLSTPEIVKSKVFSKPLNELKCRHIFLERLGLFKPRSPKSDPNIQTKNPMLYKIIDTSDKEFCKKICGISLIEFETFIELFNIEQEKAMNQNEEESDSDVD
ncbi:transcription termination factor 4, mitochondrial [Condylostylus longicornis]|uniref:transcription termination factor 4, mitochondrial n=1 Tax=Condylostylus longicornis TaxID=2530218 RepID=UPI00244E2186|nr:transcription termination factor 4, mitochondrial [Condylostylus longicornis]